jgi:hypothetical protein
LATSRAAEFIGIGLFVLSRNRWAFALSMSTALWASATPPDMVIAMWSSILYTFLPLWCATKKPIVTRVSDASMTPSLQTTPIVVVPFRASWFGLLDIFLFLPMLFFDVFDRKSGRGFGVLYFLVVLLISVVVWWFLWFVNLVVFCCFFLFCGVVGKFLLVFVVFYCFLVVWVLGVSGVSEVFVARVISGGKVTVPRRVRDVLNLELGDYVRVTITEVIKRKGKQQKRVGKMGRKR